MSNMLYLIHVFFGVQTLEERYYLVGKEFDESDTWAVSVGASSRDEATKQVVRALQKGSYKVPNLVGHAHHELDTEPEMHQHGWRLAQGKVPSTLPILPVIVAEKVGRQHSIPIVVRGNTRDMEGFFVKGMERASTLVREEFYSRVKELLEVLDLDGALLAESRDGWLPMAVLEDVTESNFVMTLDPGDELPEVEVYTRALKAVNSAQVKAAEKAILRHKKEVVRYDAKAQETRIQKG